MTNNSPNRTCIVTGEEKPQEDLLRFVLTPDRQVMPDFKKRLPGKGFYLTNSKKILTEAINKNVFRKFGKHTTIVSNLVEIVENILKNKALDSINLARKAGYLVSGFEKVKEQLSADKVAFIIQATDAGADGKNKIERAAKNIKILTLFSIEELDKALNKTNTVHIALLKGPMSNNVYNQLQKWQNFLNS